MRRALRSTVAGTAAAVLLGLAATAPRAEPLAPRSDDEIVETLPDVGGRDDERRLRSSLAERPGDPALAVRVAELQLGRARALGDPRFAGLALAALRPWAGRDDAPPSVLLMRATLQQYQHAFDASVATLRRLLARPDVGRSAPQAWLTLATVLRVQGRYADSDAACRSLLALGASLHGQACMAENRSLAGGVDEARKSFEALLADRALPAATRAWLLTSVAELEERAGRPRAAEAAWREVLQAGPDAYATIGFADFLIQNGRPREALAALAHETRNDAVLLRLAIAGRLARAPDAERDAAEMRERIAQANERPDASRLHGREQAMFALAVDGDATKALAPIRGDVAAQREPLDILVFAAAAKASGEPAAIDEAKRLQRQIGLHDRRVDALW